MTRGKGSKGDLQFCRFQRNHRVFPSKPLNTRKSPEALHVAESHWKNGSRFVLTAHVRACGGRDAGGCDVRCEKWNRLPAGRESPVAMMKTAQGMPSLTAQRLATDKSVVRCTNQGQIRNLASLLMQRHGFKATLQVGDVIGAEEHIVIGKPGLPECAC